MRDRYQSDVGDKILEIHVQFAALAGHFVSAEWCLGVNSCIRVHPA